MNVSINITGVGELLTAFDLRAAAVSAAGNHAVNKVAQRFRDVMRHYATAGHPEHPRVITGNLRMSINWHHVTDGVAQAGVTEGHPYAFYVEFGHAQEPGRFVPALGKRLVQSFVPAYPFFRPALTQVIDGGEAMEIITSYIKQAIEKAEAGEEVVPD